MKKQLFTLLGATVLLCTTSCSEDAVVPVVENGTVSINVSLADVVASRAMSDGSQATELYYEVYATEKQGEKYVAIGDALEDLDVKTTIEGGSKNISLALVKGQTYKVVFWAQAPQTYVTCKENDLRNINVGAIFTNDESKDAFTAVQEVTVSGSNSYSVTLRRPFAQVNFVTTAQDLEDALHAGAALTTSQISIENQAVASTYNALTKEASNELSVFVVGNVGGEEEVVDEVQEVEKVQDIKIGETTYKCLATAYVLASEGQSLHKLTMTLPTGLNENIVVEVPNAPLKRNYRTNIIGNLLTEQTSFQVVVDAEFNKPANNILAGTLTLSEDLVLDAPLRVLKDTKAILNLNGKTIKNQVANAATDVIVVEAGAELTIEGEGVVEAVSGNDGYAVIADGKLVINGGTYKAGVDENGEANAVVYARGKGEVYVNGGNFPNDKASKYVLNKKDADRATTVIEVRGGKFANFNPANNAAETANTNFVADGYVSLGDGSGAYEVKPLAGEITLAEDLNIAGTLVVNEELALNLNGKTIINGVKNATTDVIVVEEGAKLTIEGDGVVEAVSGNDGYAVIAKGEVVINGGTYKSGVDENGEPNAVVYARGNGKVYVNGGEFPNEYNTKYVLNKKDADRATTVIEVRGGKFQNFNPANNAAEGEGTSFVAEGYMAKANGEWWEVVEGIGVVVTNADDLVAAAAGEVGSIVASADINVGSAVEFNNRGEVTIDMAEYTMTGGDYAMNFLNDTQAVIENGDFTGGFQVAYTGSKLVFNDGKIDVKTTNTSGRYCFYAVQNAVVEINGGEFSFELAKKRAYVYAASGATVYIKGGVFGKASTNSNYKNVPMKEDGTGKVIITGGTFGFDPTNWVADGYKAEKVGNNWVVSAE